MFRQLTTALLAGLFVAFASDCTSTRATVNDGIGNDGGNHSDGGNQGDGGTDGGADSGLSSFTLDGGFVLDGGNSDGLQVDPDAGGIVLSGRDIALHFAWIANDSAGTVSKFDTQTGNEVARYYSVIPRDGLGNTTGPVSALSRENANSPSRTAIDPNGDGWIANRAPGLQGSVTKIANDVSQCRHQSDGGVHTSRDLNGDGIIDTDPAAGEFIRATDPSDWSQYDQCVLFSTPIGPAASGDRVRVRALAISGGFEGRPANVWAALWTNSTVVKLELATGRQLPVSPDGGMEIQLSWADSIGPYGAAVDGQQRLWVLSTSDTIQLALIDTQTGRLVSDAIVPPSPELDPNSAYGIAIDGKSRVWVAGWSVGPVAFRYDHGPGVDAGTGTWRRFDYHFAVSQNGTKMGRGRGIAADSQGYVWMSATDDDSSAAAAQLIGFSGDDGGVKRFNLPDGGTADFIDATNSVSNTSIGVGLDSDNNVWVNNYSGNAMRINRNSGAVQYTASQDGSLYTYSDFTGYQLRHFTQPEGNFFVDIPGCGTGTLWVRVEWDSVTPPRTRIEVRVKVANTQAALSDQATTEYGPFSPSPADLVAAGIPRAAWSRVKFKLSTDDQAQTPVLRSFRVLFSCPGPG